MKEEDTVKLLRECDSGVKMGVASIGEVLDNVSAPSLKQRLEQCKEEHQRLGNEVQAMLRSRRDQGKEPSPMAKGMSWLRTNVMLTVKKDDATVADLMTDGCNMGVKSLHRYLNQYPKADAASRDVARRLIGAEESLIRELRPYL